MPSSRRAILEAYARRASRERASDPLRLMHPHQRRVAESRSRRIALTCGRRAGKTWTILLILLSVARRFPGATIPYIALTRASARNILWAELRRVDAALQLGLRLAESKLEAVLPNGAKIALRGANKIDEIEKLRGAHPPVVAIDEAASFRPSLLKSLVEDVLEPALLDEDGTLYLCGTPGAACAGYFHDACMGAIPGWDVFHWNVLQNPALPHAEAWLEDQRAEKGWSVDNPTYVREYLGRWVRDESSLVYKFSRDRNAIDALPKIERCGTVLSHDYGYVDSTAWALLHYEMARSANRNTYVGRSFAHAGLTPSEAAAVTAQLRQEHLPQRMVGDAGGLGKGYIAEHNRRFPGACIEAADKTEKRAYVELLNDDLRCGRLLVVSSQNSDLIEELETLQWDVDKQTVDQASIAMIGANHLSDAALYGWRASQAFANRPKPPVQKLRRADEDGDEKLVEASQRRLRAQGGAWWDRSGRTR